MPTYPEVELLRLATVGGVDDGKSTLVGRLLHDSKSLLADHLAAAESASRRRGRDETDLSLITDGLRAEREQGITIDVAHRYFATARRRFILADTPGHVQYTRNMVTGSSTADLAVVLVDATRGIVEQTRRHLAVTALLRVPHVVLAVNKMDLVGFREEVFASIAERFAADAAALGVAEVTAIPTSALAGDNVAHPSAAMDWYGGPTLLEHLETVPCDPRTWSGPARFPVQSVLLGATPLGVDGPCGRRGYAGRLESGVLRTGADVVVLPSGQRARIAAIDVLGRAADELVAEQSATVYLDTELDVARGDLIAPVEAAPEPVRSVSGVCCQVAERPLRPDDRVLLKQGTRTVPAVVADIPYRLEISAADGPAARREAPGELRVNEIGAVVLRTTAPVMPDEYRRIRRTGAFLVIDPADGATLAAGMAGPAFAPGES
ncbi:MAG TPA: GTP-binding protein [Actinospica sp.]|nr:GTP-binding protein [Actinospica sp.]